MLFGEGLDDPKVYGTAGLIAGAIMAFAAIIDRLRTSYAGWRKTRLDARIEEERAQTQLDEEQEQLEDKRDRRLSGQLHKIIERLERERQADRVKVEELQTAYVKHVAESNARERACEERTARLDGRVQYLSEKLADQGRELKRLEADNTELRRALGWGEANHCPLVPGETCHVVPHGPDSPAKMELPVIPPETDPA